MKEFGLTKEEMNYNKKKTYSELQRLATSFGIYGKDLEDNFLYSKVSTEIMKLKNENNKLKFMNKFSKDKILQYQIKDKDTYIEEISKGFNKRILLLKKDINDLNIISNRKDEEITYLKMRLKQEINKNEINQERKVS